MNIRYLLTRLILPLLTGAAVCLFFARRLPAPWEGLAVNIAAALLGSIITIFYVDVILRRHDQVLWKRVRAKALGRLERLANIGISSVRGAFHIPLRELWDKEMSEPENLGIALLHHL